jgi:hypothetical protein
MKSVEALSESLWRIEVERIHPPLDAANERGPAELGEEGGLWVSASDPVAGLKEEAIPIHVVDGAGRLFSGGKDTSCGDADVGPTEITEWWCDCLGAWPGFDDSEFRPCPERGVLPVVSELGEEGELLANR